MKPHTQAVREAQAWNRIMAAIKANAYAVGLDSSSLDVTNRNPALQQMFRMEALADFLEAGMAPAKHQVMEPDDTLPKTAEPTLAKVEAKPAKGKEGGTL
jgi:hypothetical protein